MKKLIFTLISGMFITATATAQYCGNSGSSVCTPLGTMMEPGLSPNSTELPAVVNGTDANTTIQFKNFNKFIFNGTEITINSLKIDEINNLPDGSCWATNKANNTFANQEDGCIKVTGTVQSCPGQYKLEILVTAQTNIGVIGPGLNAETVGLDYYVRVINAGETAPAVDTNQTVAYSRTGYTVTAGCFGTGVSEVNGVNQLTVVPNPFSNRAVVSFTSERSSVMTEKITNMLGAVVYNGTINVKAGENSSVIDAANLVPGVYFYSLTDGKNAITKRVVVAE